MSAAKNRVLQIDQTSPPDLPGQQRHCSGQRGNDYRWGLVSRNGWSPVGAQALRDTDCLTSNVDIAHHVVGATLKSYT